MSIQQEYFDDDNDDFLHPDPSPFLKGKERESRLLEKPSPDIMH